MHSHIVVGLSYGDEGKGSWVDHLVREHGIRQVARFNGGPQALHHVVSDDGRVHGFRHFGSGMLDSQCFTLLSRFMLVDPQAMFEEATVLESKGVEAPMMRTVVSENAPIITPFNRLLNKIQEVGRGAERHGSCGFGIGITQKDVDEIPSRALYVRDIRNGELRQKLTWLKRRRVEEAKQWLCEETKELFATLCEIDHDYYEDLYFRWLCNAKVVSETDFQDLVCSYETVFEGAQGVLLDQTYGFFPHVTRSNCTFKNAETLLREAAFKGEVTRVGLLRAYGSRHGAGPFVTEDTSLNLSACNNGVNPWQGKFRLGWFDAVAVRYALEVAGGVDLLAVTNLDRLAGQERLQYATSYCRGDERFFSLNRIIPIPFDKAVLSERSLALAHVLPLYEETSGWLQEEDVAMHHYLDLLGKAVGQRIGAYSYSAQHRKTYR